MISCVASSLLILVFCAYTSLAQTPTTSYKIGRNGMATPIVINFIADMPLPTVSYHCNNFPGICANIAARLGPGITSRVVTYDSNKGRATSRRRSSNVCGKAVRDRCAWQGACDPLFQNFPDMWPTSCDEFPFASTVEGGPGFSGPNIANQVRARRQCVPSREQNQQGRLQSILATLIASGSAQNYRNDGLAHQYVLQLDYSIRLDPVNGLPNRRYHGRVTAGGATPPPGGTPFSCSWIVPSPGSSAVCDVVSQNPRPLPAQMPNNGYQSSLKYQGRQYNCPKAPSCATPPFVPRGIDEELFVSYNASEHGLERRQVSCPAPEPLDTAPAQAAAAAAAVSVAAAALAELSAALLTALIAARRLVDEIQHDIDVVQQVISGSLPSSDLATAIESAAAALSDFDNYIFVNDTSETNQAAQDIMDGIDDAATDAFSFMQNVVSIMNNNIPDDDGSFGATVLVPGDVSTTSVAATTTFVETVTPPAPPPTTTDELPAPTSGDNSFGHLIRRSYADMSDVADGAMAHITIIECPNDGSALSESTLANFSGPATLEQVVLHLGKPDSSVLPELAFHLPQFEGREADDLCVECNDTSDYNVLYCGATLVQWSIDLMYKAWTASDRNQFVANLDALVHNVDFFLGQSSSFIASNETSNAEYRDASDIWHYLADHHTDSGFYPS